MSPHLNRLAICLLLLSLPACGGAPESAAPDCASSQIQIAPTPTHVGDPDLAQPPQLVPGGGDGAFYCPTPVPPATPGSGTPGQLVAAEVTNLALDRADQQVAAAAVGRDRLAVAWLQDGGIYLALARGGNRFQVRRVDDGTAVALAFSPADRLHIAYEQAGQIIYRAADFGRHPADTEQEIVAAGRAPHLLLNQYHYAQIVFTADGQLHHAAQLQTGQWQVAPIAGAAAGGSDVASATYGEDLTLSHLIGYRGAGGTVELARWQTTPYGFFPSWQPLTSFTPPLGETLLGAPQVAVSADAAGTWQVAAWVTRRLNPLPALPDYRQPLFAAANPLYPHQLANPQQIHSGLNAARWQADPLQPQPFAAGLRQTVSVANPAGFLTFSAWGLAEALPDAALSLRLGIDPTGDDSPNGPAVVWSAQAAPDRFGHFSVTVPATGSRASVFLHATLDGIDVGGTAVWDSADLQNGTLLNGDFEGPFSAHNTLSVPDGWEAYYEDGGNSLLSGRDTDTVYAAWSSDGGQTWTAPQIVMQNRDASGSLTGALRPMVYPLLSTEGRTPTASFVYLYEAGDPPTGSSFRRFGRPMRAVCDLLTADCMTTPPGDALLARSVTRPSTHLLVAPDPLDAGRALLVWDGLQPDLERNEIYATTLVWR